MFCCCLSCRSIVGRKMIFWRKFSVCSAEKMKMKYYVIDKDECSLRKPFFELEC